MQIDGIVNHVDAVVAGMIAALVAVRDGNMSPEPLFVFHSRQCKQLRNQVAGNIRRYEPGRRERINQDLQLAHFKWPTVVKVFILRLKNALFPAKIGNKAFSNEALNIETVRDAIRTRDLPLRSTIEPLSSVFTYVQESRFSSGFFRIPNLFRFTEVRLCR